MARPPLKITGQLGRVIGAGVTPPAPPTPPTPVPSTPTRRAAPPPGRAVTPSIEAGAVPSSPVEPPIGRVPPAGLSSQQLVGWIKARLGEHEALRAASFWETGHLIGLLLPRGRSVGAKDIKELVERAELGIAHMTAQKYVMVARSFPVRELAVKTGIEKCYALTVYAKTIGREGQAAAILEQNELIEGSDDGRGRRLRAGEISGVRLREAIRALKAAAASGAAANGAAPSEVQREREAAAKQAQAYARKLGMAKAVARVVRHGGEPKIALYLPVAAAASLETKAPLAALALVARLARTDAAFAARAREMGLLRRAA